MASNAPILHISNPVLPCQNILIISWFEIHIDDRNARKAKNNFTLITHWQFFTFFSYLTNISNLRCNWVWSMCTLTYVSVCFPVLIILYYFLKKDIKWWSSSSSTQPATQRRVEPAILTFCLPDTPGQWFCPHTWPASWLVYSINAWDEHCPIYLTGCVKWFFALQVL